MVREHNWDDFDSLKIGSDKGESGRREEVHALGILQSELGLPTAKISRESDDLKRGIDIVADSNNISCRYRRRNAYDWNDEFTVRIKRPSGHATEISKLHNIDYSIYCVLPPQGKPPAWMIYYVPELLRLMRRGVRKKSLTNYEGQVMNVYNVADTFTAIRVWNTDHPALKDMMYHHCDLYGILTFESDGGRFNIMENTFQESASGIY